MNPWMIGVEKALATVSQGIESSNGALMQIGLDRLQTRSEMSSELAEIFPNAFAEAVQEGVAKLWRKKLDQSGPMERRDLAMRPSWPALVEDMPWLLCILSKQDDWSRICVEEATRLLAYSSARCEPMLAASTELDLVDCVHAASGFFTALTTLDRLSRLGEVDIEAKKAVGSMLSAYGADERGAGPVWGRCEKLRGLVGLTGPGSDLSLQWPSSAGVHPATIIGALASLHHTEDAQDGAKPARRAPRG